MEMTAEIISEGRGEKKHKGGIKSFTFTASGKNGTSHRLNKVRKQRQHLANVVARAELYQSRGTMGALQWHERLKALSNGTI